MPTTTHYNGIIIDHGSGGARWRIGWHRRGSAISCWNGAVTCRGSNFEIEGLELKNGPSKLARSLFRDGG